MKKYRKGVGIFLLNDQKQLWVGERIDFKSNFWQMPQGGIDRNELPEEAMRRELMEEVGLKENYEILEETKNWLRYDLPEELVDSVWNGKYFGQEQKWFACKFFGDDNEIKLDCHKPEFKDWKWIEPSRSLDLVVPFKRNLYVQILQDFKKFYT